MRPLTAPAAGREYAFRCTTAGTSSTEPTWPAADGGTVTTGGATFTNVTGRSTYGWSAAGGTVYLLTAQAASSRSLAAGDRVFVSSDHSESAIGSLYQFGGSFGLIQFLSVNRAGSVPPVAADLLAGAAISAGGLILDAACNTLWQGFTFTNPGSTAANINFNNAGLRSHYLKNCALVMTNTNAASKIATNNAAAIVLDNTTVQFGNAGQVITYSYNFDVTWINTPSAIQGATIPTTLFSPGGSSNGHITCRGVDLSAITGTLVGAGTTGAKVLFDSCKIASGVTRFGTPVYTSDISDSVELVNCYDGTNVINERYGTTGSVVTDRSTYLTGGAQDDIGNYSLKMVSSSRSDFQAQPTDCFAFDVENTATGSSKTATVEIVSSLSLNNTDIRLLLEYMGTSGNPIASFGDSLASVLTASSALSTSSSSWTNAPSGLAPQWNSADLLNVTLSGSNLIMTGTGSGGARMLFGYTSGKYYWESTIGTWTNNNTACGIITASGSLASAASGFTVATAAAKDGSVWVNGTKVGSAVLGARSSGDIIGVAVDFTAQLIWYRVAPSGNWNGSGTANPATGAGGYSFSALGAGSLYPLGIINASSDALTANFGGSSFSGAVPSGFASGFTGTTTAKQLLQVSFTPQRAGRVRGLVRLGKTSTTVWVNPQITIT